MNFLTLLKKNHKFLMIFILLVIFAVSAFFYAFHFKGSRYSFEYYVSGTNEIVFETRSVASIKGVSKVKAYVEEYLLGPTVHRARPVFPLESRVLFCFERQGILFLNLSEEAVLDLSPDVNLFENYKLLQKNVSSNFPHIKKIELFIDGKSVFSDAENPPKYN